MVRDNPLLGREFDKRMRERNAFLVPALYVTILTFVFGTGYIAASRWSQPWETGALMFKILTSLSTLLVGLLVPIFAAGSITIEREQKTLCSLVLTRLKPRDIVFGKAVAAAAYVLLVALTSVPLILISFLFGGTTLGAFALHYLSLTVLAVFLACMGVYVSAHFKRSVYAIALQYALLALTATLGTFLLAYLRTLQYALHLPVMRYVAFLNPLFFVDEATRWQWPIYTVFYSTLAAAFAWLAAARLRELRPL